MAWTKQARQRRIASTVSADYPERYPAPGENSGGWIERVDCHV